jgi:hypothetical protein
MNKNNAGLAIKTFTNYSCSNSPPPSSICGRSMGELIKQESQGR